MTTERPRSNEPGQNNLPPGYSRSEWKVFWKKVIRLELIMAAAGFAIVLDGILRRDDLKFLMIVLGTAALVGTLALKIILRRYGIDRNGARGKLKDV